MNNTTLQTLKFTSFPLKTFQYKGHYWTQPTQFISIWRCCKSVPTRNPSDGLLVSNCSETAYPQCHVIQQEVLFSPVARAPIIWLLCHVDENFSFHEYIHVCMVSSLPIFKRFFLSSKSSVLTFFPFYVYVSLKFSIIHSILVNLSLHATWSKYVYGDGDKFVTPCSL